MILEVGCRVGESVVAADKRSTVSMTAEFVQVSPGELTGLAADPSSVGRLLHGPVGSFAPLMAGAARERLERLAPQVLSDAMRRLDPRLQEEFAQRIGVVREALASEEGGKALIRLMESRGLVGDEAGVSEPAESQRPRVSLDKAWHGLHYLLHGEPEPSPDGWGGPILGGTEIGEDEGYGPARYFDVDEVAQIAATLDGEGLDDELRSRYEPGGMAELGIYPGGWDETGPDWLLDAFRDLRAFFHDAAASGNAIVTCLV